MEIQIFSFTSSNGISNTVAYKIILEGDASECLKSEWKSVLSSVLASSPSRIEIDLASVRKVDSSFIQSLIVLKKQSYRKGWSLVLSNHSPALLEYFNLFGLIGYFRDVIKLSKNELAPY
ncbi:hypothetical protein CH373_16340 [Leptospira perolatii]|uniref:STAS domain-containing protein n=1 Tax=Leptospira perolatii TaxID=2023191 RepID=A0A2M9ZIZ6_9LEPT|nr:STAS domain-containing protein [Leptospira perolatii]PJZ69513.1 hypothetical protein CH360_10940 [Leptospira perolatii]PJZ72028.1 hypothetical protein CH373_16340 [Leptospira perolatii]